MTIREETQADERLTPSYLSLTDENAETFERLINLGHLSSGIGHHVINALSAIVSNAELLRLKSPRIAIDPVALSETIISTALEAATVARRLIDYTRPVTSIEPDRAAFEPHSLSLDRLVLEFAEAEQARTNRPEILWQTRLAPLPAMKGHPTQLRLMLAHLTQNAYDAFGESGGTITLATSIDHRGWNVLEFQDNGHGMEQGILERAVEPFFSTRPGHLGVGLSIANGVWRRHRGTLSIQSRCGEGTRFKLCVEPDENRRPGGVG